MRKTILAATMLILTSMVAPRHAASQVSIDIEKPGLSLHAGPPVYAPPVVVAPPAVVYQGYPPYYGPPPPDKHYWKHREHWDRHHWHHDHWD